VTVRLGDWRDVLPGTYDPARSVVITDPPFGLSAPGGVAVRAPGSHLATEDGGRGYPDQLSWAEHVRQVLELLPAVRHVIRGPSTALIRRDYPAPRRLCVELSAYRKRSAHRPGVIPYLWLGWAVYGRLLVGRHDRVPAGDGLLIRPYVDDGLRTEGTGHRGITPYSAALWIVETWADPGMTVLDPFAGTGTIGRAAGALGLDYLGAEIVPRWHAEALASLRHSQPALELA
jgi:DNA methylase